MVKRAGCASVDCPCHVVGGSGVHVSGLGSGASPFVVSTDGQPASIRGGLSESITVSVAGSGSVASPFLMSAVVYDPNAASSPNVERFTRDGVWVKPSGSSLILVTVVGAGGGGSAGGSINGPLGVPGPGGGGGGWTQTMLHSTMLPATVPLTVGVGGNGGVGVGGTYGQAGIRGGDSKFGPYLMAGGGAGGIYSTAVVNELPNRSIGSESGGTTLSSVARSGRGTYKAGAGGGHGGPDGMAAPADVTNLEGGLVLSYTGPAQTPPTAAGSNPGLPAPAGLGGGGGGQGGWGHVIGGNPDGSDISAKSGREGGYPGGGGGGGGAVLTGGSTPGSGGKGADGWIEIITWSTSGGQWDATDPAILWDSVAPAVTWNTWEG